MTLRRPATDDKGFTLVELLLYVGGVGTLLLMTSLLMMTVLQARVKTAAIAEVEQQGAFVAAYMTQTIRSADSVSLPTAGGSGVVLTMALPSPATSPVSFSVNGASLQVQEGVAAPVALTSPRVQISAVTFSSLGRSGTPGTIRYSFIVSHTNPSGRSEYSYQRQFSGSAALR